MADPSAAPTGQPATAAEGPWRLSLAMAGDVLCLAADRGLRRAVLAAVCRQGLLGPPDPAAPCAGRAGDSAPLYEVCRGGRCVPPMGA